MSYQVYNKQPTSAANIDIPMKAYGSQAGCPPGLEPLLRLDKILVKQKKEFIEVLTGWETNNKYEILNSQGQKIFYAAEDTNPCMRICCGPQRGFTIHIVNNNNQEVLRISREFKCCAGCCWCAGCCSCCAHVVEVSLPSGEIIGYIKQGGSCWSAHYKILDENMNQILKIKGPCCICDGPCCPCDNNFQLVNNDGAAVGRVQKVYSGIVKEMFTDADNFCIEFPPDLSVKSKSTLLGALFLIDFMFFEKDQNNNNCND